MPTVSLQKSVLIPRSPVVCVMGHIDHGKSTLLDYVRKTNIVDKEAGGITQKISAYEFGHATKEGKKTKITFLDTPGHEAFQAMRSRGALAADVAILVVSAEDGVKPQTVEALKAILAAKIPYVVAITKIDKPDANVEKTKQSLAEHEIYLEGYGGNISFVPISSKTGEGVSDLLDMVVLSAELEDIKGDLSAPAQGVVIESHLDKEKGISATLIIKNGTLKKGVALVSEGSLAPVRNIDDFAGKRIEEASFSSPVRIIGWTKMPKVGSRFIAYPNKKAAQKVVDEFVDELSRKAPAKKILPPATAPAPAIGSDGKIKLAEPAKVIIPILIKADVQGTIGAIEHEIKKLGTDKVGLQVVHTGVGAITESDIKMIAGGRGAIVIGFNANLDPRAKTMVERFGIKVLTFDIIYRVVEELQKIIAENTPKVLVEELKGTAKILKLFSKDKDKQIVGGRVLEGVIGLGAELKIIRRDSEIGRGKIRELQKMKEKATEIQKDNEFGALIQSTIEIAVGDRIESFVMAEK